MKKKANKWLLMVVVAVMVFSTCLPCVGLIASALARADGIVAHFSFDDENALVDGVNGFALVPGGGSTVYANGRNGNYLNLASSSSSYVDLPLEILEGLNEFSFSCWIKPNSLLSPYTRIFEIGNVVDGTPTQWISFLYHSNGTLSCSSTLRGVGPQAVAQSNATLADGAWSHLVFTSRMSGTGAEYCIWLNSVLVLKVNMPTQISKLQASSVRIGESIFPGDPHLDAGLDDIKIYNYALSANEIDADAGISTKDAVQTDLDAIVIPSEVYSTKLPMLQHGNNGTAIKWTTSNSSIVGLDGYVYREDNSDHAVTLTAEISKGDIKMTKQYNIVVKALAANTYAGNTVAENVTLTESEFTVARDLNKDYMLSLSVDRLLVNYYKTSGISTNYKEYGGWITEANGGAGTIEAHYLSALVYLYAEEKDPQILQRINQYLDAWDRCQKEYAVLHPDEAGYFGAVKTDDLKNLEKYGSALWTVYYIIEKNLSALYDAYKYLGSQKAYDIMVKLANFVSNRVNNYDEATMQRVYRKEYGGIAMIMFKIYMLTESGAHLKTAQRFCEPYVFDTILQGGDPFDWKHVNTAIPKVYSAAWGYLATGDKDYLTVAQRGFQLLIEGRAFATGNVSEVEEMHPAHELDTEGFQSCETCCSYNLMRLCDVLYNITGDKDYMDYYERLLYNCILSSIDPQTGYKTYYVSMDSGYYKVYHTATTSFWCCTGTGFENFTKFNQNIYYNTPNSLTVNNFIPSTYTDDATGLGIKLETQFPAETEVRFVITSGASTTLRIRDPFWTNGNSEVFINGVKIEKTLDEFGYIAVTSNFQVGDVVSVNFPMTFRLEELGSTIQDECYAIMYGPLVMNGVIESIGNIDPIQSNSMTGKDFNGKIKDELFFSGATVFDGLQKLNDMKYVLVADNQSVLIEPFYKCHREKYIIYWNIYRTESDEQYTYIDKQNQKASYMLDSIDCGNWFEESTHEFASEGTWQGNYSTEHNRGLVKGGWFSYRMKVERGVENQIRIMHFGTDSGYSYAVYVSGVKIKTVNITAKGAHFYWEVIDIPTRYTKSADYVTIKIVCTEGTLTTGIYTMQTWRASLPQLAEDSCTLDAGASKTIDCRDALCDKILLEGSGEVALYGTTDGSAWQKIYQGNATAEICRFAQYKQLKITAISAAQCMVKVFGDQVVSVESISYTKANAADRYIGQQFAQVKLQNSGTVRLRINWNSVPQDSTSGFATLYRTNIAVAYNIDVKAVTDGLIVYYDFENMDGTTVRDASGNGNDGTACGSVRAANGKFGKGLNLGGLDGYVQLPHINGMREITVSLWVRVNSTTDLLYQRVFDWGTDRKNYLTFAMCGYAAGCTNGNVTTVSDRVYTFGVGQWYFYTLTVKDGVAISYLNGVEISRNSNFNFNMENLDSFVNATIGKASIKYTPYLNGIVDEFRMYNYAMTKDQVKGLFLLDNSTSATFPSVDEVYFGNANQK